MVTNTTASFETAMNAKNMACSTSETFAMPRSISGVCACMGSRECAGGRRAELALRASLGKVGS
jgi:hypothetical protein